MGWDRKMEWVEMSFLLGVSSGSSGPCQVEEKGPWGLMKHVLG